MTADVAGDEGPLGDPRWRRADALADRTRFAAHRYLLDAAAPRSVSEITEAVGVHHTTVRAHLVKLRDAGLVVETRAEPSGRGRPRLLYAATAEAGTGTPRDPYLELSSMLVRAVRDRRTPRQVGFAAGRASAARSDPDPALDTVDLIEREARSLGFDPVRHVDGIRQELVLRTCPFADVATVDPESICSLHLGMAEGVAERRGDVEVLELVVRPPHRGGCRLRLQPVDAGSSPGRNA